MHPRPPLDQPRTPAADSARRSAGRRSLTVAALLIVALAACSGTVGTGLGSGGWARTITVRDAGGLTQIARLNRVDLQAGDSLIVETVGRNDGSDSVLVWLRMCDEVAAVDPNDLEGPQVRCLVADFQVMIGPRDSIVARTPYLVLPRGQSGPSTLAIHLPQAVPLDVETVVTLHPAPDA